MSVIIKPFAWMLLQFYEITGSYALALILFSLVIKTVLFPFFMKGKKGMMRMSRLQPMMKELEKKYEGNRQKYAIEVQKLYKAEGVSPMSGCLWNLIPFPFLILLYTIIRKPITQMMGLSSESLGTIANALTSFGVTEVADYSTSYGEMALAQQATPFADRLATLVPGFVGIDFSMFGLNLASNPSFLFFLGDDPWHWANIGLFLIPIISGAFALLQMIISQKLNPPAVEQNNKMMLFMMPLISIWIGYAMPAGMSIYWIANSAIGILQDWFATMHYRKIFAKEDAVKLAEAAERERIAEEKRRQREERLAKEGPQRDKNTSKKKMQKIERAQAEEAERAYKEKTGQIKKKNTDDRPFARGRAYDPNRYANQRPKVDEQISSDNITEENVEDTAGKALGEAQSVMNPLNSDTSNNSVKTFEENTENSPDEISKDEEK